MLLISNWPYTWNCHVRSTSPLVTSLLYVSLFIGILQIFVKCSSHRRHFINLLQEQVFPFKEDISSLSLKKCLKRDFCLTVLHRSLQPNKIIGILILTCFRFLLTWKECWVFLSKPWVSFYRILLLTGSSKFCPFSQNSSISGEELELWRNIISITEEKYDWRHTR